MENKNIKNMNDFYKKYYPKKYSSNKEENLMDMKSYVKFINEKYNCEVKKIIEKK
jgi:hypothetical protein